MSTTSAVQFADLTLEESLQAGYTLPAEWYTDTMIFALERTRIFRRSWQYVGLLEQLTNPGDFFTTRIGDVPLVLSRDQEGQIRAFVNVCRHRGSELVLAECGHRQTLQCHYHAWTYNLDGSLRAAPGSKDEPGFEPSQLSLIAVPVDTWGPFIFVNPDRQAQPLSTVLGQLPQLTAASGIRLGDIRRRARRTYDIAANWKIVVDNYLECYHCPVAHKSFSDLIDVNNYTVTEYDYFSVQGGALRQSAQDGIAQGLYATGGEVTAGFYAYLWPNFTLNIYPGPGNVSLNLFLPVDTNRTLAIYEYCFVDEVSREEEEDFVRFIDQVQDEDIVLCESVQRGLTSGYFDRGRLMLRREKALRHFQQLVYRSLERA
jgi:phenylpropionate dioxygenase-like ring-hydroxylating dioxygenase large terminal subunit